MGPLACRSRRARFARCQRAGKLRPENLQGFQQVFAVRELGNGGDTFIRGIAEKLKQIAFMGEAFEISIDGFKDPSALYCDDSEQFRERFGNAMNHANPDRMRPHDLRSTH